MGNANRLLEVQVLTGPLQHGTSTQFSGLPSAGAGCHHTGRSIEPDSIVETGGIRGAGQEEDLECGRLPGEYMLSDWLQSL